MSDDPTRVVDAEMEFHISERAKELRRDEGLDPDEARRRAEAEFGDREATRTYCLRQDRARARRERWHRGVRTIRDDVVGALRALGRRPGSVAGPGGVLAVAVALNVLVFTVVRAVLLQPLPFLAAERVHVVEEVQEGGGLVRAAYRVIEAWREESRSTEVVAGYLDGDYTLGGAEGASRMAGAAVTEGFFDLLDRPILRGRAFLEAEHRPGAPGRVVISEKLWRSRFGGRVDAVGSRIRLDGRPHEVVGIVREEAGFPDGRGLWVPVESSAPQVLDVTGAKILVGIARIRPGVDAEQVERELGQLSAEVPGGASEVRATPLHERLRGDVRTPLLLMQAAVLLVLLAACANAGGMLLTRAARRSGELAVRTSLGVSRGRLARVFLLEGGALGAAAGVVGLGVAALLLRPALALVPRELPLVGAGEIGLDPGVALLGLGLALGTGVATAVVPALSGASVEPSSLLRRASGSAGGSPWLRSVLEGLVVGQLALAVLLTVGAGLLVRSFVATVSEDPGFDPSRVTVLQLSLPGYAYPEASDRLGFARELLERARGLPGATAVALGRNLPVTGSNMTSPLIVEGSEGTTEAVQVATVTDDYFEVMRIPLVQGESFGSADRVDGPPRLVVGETVRDPRGELLGPGRRAHSFFGPTEMRDVVGVAGAVRHGGLRQQPPPIVYRSFFQTGGSGGFALLVRSDAPPATVSAAAQELVREMDPELPADRVATMSAHLRRSLAEPRFYTAVMSVFAGLAVLLALAGCQAGLAHRVAARRGELGVRIALGASRPAVRRLVRRRGLALTALGAALGIVGALPTSRLLESQLYGVEPTDPWTYLGIVVLLLAAGAIASDVPARWASRVDPVEMLR